MEKTTLQKIAIGIAVLATTATLQATSQVAPMTTGNAAKFMAETGIKPEDMSTTQDELKKQEPAVLKKIFEEKYQLDKHMPGRAVQTGAALRESELDDFIWGLKKIGLDCKDNYQLAEKYYDNYVNARKVLADKELYAKSGWRLPKAEWGTPTHSNKNIPEATTTNKDDQNKIEKLTEEHKKEFWEKNGKFFDLEERNLAQQIIDEAEEKDFTAIMSKIAHGKSVTDPDESTAKQKAFFEKILKIYEAGWTSKITNMYFPK